MFLNAPGISLFADVFDGPGISLFADALKGRGFKPRRKSRPSTCGFSRRDSQPAAYAFDLRAYASGVISMHSHVPVALVTLALRATVRFFDMSLAIAFTLSVFVNRDTTITPSGAR